LTIKGVTIGICVDNSTYLLPPELDPELRDDDPELPEDELPDDPLLPELRDEEPLE
jgi:hypothetical protein